MPDHSPVITSLDAQLSILGVALAQWAVRDDGKAQPEIRQAGNTAVAAIDDMLVGLHRIRGQLVTEVRQAMTQPRPG